MGKYRKYRKPKRVPGRRLRGLLPALGIALSLLYALLAVYGYVPVEGEFFDLRVDGARVLNATLYRVTYVAPTENRSYVVRLQVDGHTEDFVVPAGEENRRLVLGESRLIEVEREVVQTRVVVLDGASTQYPGPPVNMSRVGRYEDFILTHYPLELYFVYTVQLCNVSFRVKPAGASIAGARVAYRDREGGDEKEVPLSCAGGSCEGSLERVCAHSYRVDLDLVLLGVLRLRREGGRTVLRFSDNLWIPATALAATIASLYLVSRRSRRRSGPRKAAVQAVRA